MTTRVKAAMVSIFLIALAADLAAQQPQLQPLDVRPQLLNAREMADSILAQTADLRDPRASDWILALQTPNARTAIQARGVVHLWVFVDSAGTVTRSQLDDSSAQSPLGAVVYRLVPRMRFEAGKFRGQDVTAWHKLSFFIE
jgi:hypothetical protein